MPDKQVVKDWTGGITLALVWGVPAVVMLAAAFVDRPVSPDDGIIGCGLLHGPPATRRIWLGDFGCRDGDGKRAYPVGSERILGTFCTDS